MNNVQMADETRSIGKPKDWNDAEHGECFSISVTDVASEIGNMMVTAWQPTHEELDTLNSGGYIYLGIRGLVHPVIQIYVN